MPEIDMLNAADGLKGQPQHSPRHSAATQWQGVAPGMDAENNQALKRRHKALPSVSPPRLLRPLATLLALILCAFTITTPARAQNMDLFGGGAGLDNFQLEESSLHDAELLKHTHFSEFKHWPLVASEHSRWREKGVDYRWVQTPIDGQPGDRLFIKPLTGEPIENTINVPVDGDYRIWLCYVGEVGSPHPVKVNLTGANDASHVFGAKRVPKRDPAEIPSERTIRFDSDIGAMSAGSRPVVVWERWDLHLSAGETKITVASDDKGVLLDALLITQSKTFVPSKSSVEDEGNLHHTWYRYRVREAPSDVEAVRFSSFIHYMWAHYRPPSTTRIWYSGMGGFATPDGDADIPVGDWTYWKESSEQTTNQGTYFADKLTITDAETGEELDAGTVEVQLAWLDNEHTVLRTIEVPIDEGWARYLVPVDRTGGYRSSFSTDQTPVVWGARHPEYVSKLRNESQFLAELMASIDPEALKPGDMPERIRLWTSVNTARSAWPEAVELLKKVGVNWFPKLPYDYKMAIGSPPEVQIAQQSGTIAVHSHDPMDPLYEQGLLSRSYGKEALERYAKGDPEFYQRSHWVKMGDEIGKITSATHINGLPDCRAKYLDYMRQQANGDPAYFGVERFEDLYYDPQVQPNMTLPQRRRFYHDMRFSWWFTAQFYLRHTETAQTNLPNVLTRCNYTPGGPMFAGTMDTSNWFALPRYNVSTAHMGEDWLGATGYTSHAGTQTESYYGAIMNCAVRKHGQPMDFIMVGRSSALDRKLAILAGAGIHSIYAYDWGPEYTRGAVDTFSNVLRSYEELNRGMRALGPAEDVLVDGERLPHKAAILYNRTNEIWHGGAYGVFSDRLYTYVALKHSFVNSDLLLEEDLTADILSQYDVLYINGLNIRRETIPALRAWVEQGGTLVAAGGSAMADEFDNPIPEAEDLLGARAFPAGASEGRWMAFYISDHKPIDQLTLKETDLTPAITTDVVGLKCILEPTTGQVIGTYKDGSPGAVLRELGEGRVLTLGISPGLAYAQNAPRDEASLPTTYTADRRALVTKPALAAVGPLAVTYTEPLADIVTYRTPDAMAIILVDFSYQPDKPATLTVKTDRKITSITGSLRGEYQFTQQGNTLTIDCPTPDPVDILLLK